MVDGANPIMVKADLKDLESEPRFEEDSKIKMKNIRKMFLGRSGEHCILLAEHELFYNNWYDSEII